MINNDRQRVSNGSQLLVDGIVGGCVDECCTQEIQNRVSHSIQNWTGTDGVLDVLSDGKCMYRFIKIDKLTTASATSGSGESRPYRYGYGVFDKNFNYAQDEGEKKVYFEISDFATNYIFYENPN